MSAAQDQRKQMPEDWTRQEVEATVRDYFSMLNMELRGERYNKTEHRQRLASMLSGRSDGAIERKHQNISAILIELRFPYIQGYKPLRNYQQLLFDVTAERLAISQPLVDVVEAQVQQAAVIPTVDDILASLTRAPGGDGAARPYVNGVRERPLVPRRVDYLQLESRNRSLGAAGEEFVLRFETARLLRARLDGLASRVERVPQTRGDGLGFDILSFEESGAERLVEVKTTAYGRETPFFVTRTEVDVSRRQAEQYFLYRVFDFRRAPRLFQKQGHLERSFILDPVQYLAAVV